MASQAEILRGLHVVQRVAERGEPLRQPGIQPRAASARPRAARDRRRPSVVRADLRAPRTGLVGPTHDASRDATLLAVQAAFDAHTVKFSRVLEVSFTAEDPQVAATAVNNAMDIYIKDQYAAKHRAVDRATEWLDKRAAELRQEVHDGEDRIAAYRAQPGPGAGHARRDGRRGDQPPRRGPGARAHRAGQRRGQAGRRARPRRRGGPGGDRAQRGAASRAQQDQLSAQIQSQQGRLGPNHPEALGLQRQFADAQRAVAAETARVVAATEAELRAARERVATLEQDLRNGEQAADRSAAAQVALNAMQRDVDASRQQLQAVLDSIQQTGQQAAIESSEAHEISLALPPDTPSFPRTVPLMAAAVAFGVCWPACLLVYLLELADTTLRSGEAVRAAFGLPCFALLPEMSRRQVGHLSVDEYVARKPLSPFAEQVRTLRTGLWMGAERPRVIAVTAARPGEGKTTVALALGAIRGAERRACAGHGMRPAPPDFRHTDASHRAGGPGRLPAQQAHRGRGDLHRRDHRHGRHAGRPDRH